MSATIPNKNSVGISLRNPHVLRLMPEARGILFRNTDSNLLGLADLDESFAKAFQLFDWPSDGGIRLAKVDLDDLSSVSGAGVFDVHGDDNVFVFDVDLQVCQIKLGIRQTVTEWEESVPANLFVIPVADIDVLSVNGASAFGSVIQKGRIILVSDGERQ